MCFGLMALGRFPRMLIYKSFDGCSIKIFSTKLVKDCLSHMQTHSSKLKALCLSNSHQDLNTTSSKGQFHCGGHNLQRTKFIENICIWKEHESLNWINYTD